MIRLNRLQRLRRLALGLLLTSLTIVVCGRDCGGFPPANECDPESSSDCSEGEICEDSQCCKECGAGSSCPNSRECVSGCCGSAPTCGNDTAEPEDRPREGEDCDGQDLRNQTCASLELGDGPLGCKPPDDPDMACTFDTSGCHDPCEDADQDGSCIEDDCNDHDRDIHPGQPEICDDGIDNDCDSTTADLGDNDGDGVTCDLDCNDHDASVHPGADEGCDGIDTDCDGSLSPDEVDGDGDHVWSCAGDCDDADASVHPGRGEDCSNGIDDNCDDLIDGDDPECQIGCEFDPCAQGERPGDPCQAVDPCVMAVCAVDPFCCNRAWDGTCVRLVDTHCSPGTCPGPAPPYEKICLPVPIQFTIDDGASVITVSFTATLSVGVDPGDEFNSSLSLMNVVTTPIPLADGSFLSLADGSFLSPADGSVLCVDLTSSDPFCESGSLFCSGGTTNRIGVGDGDVGVCTGDASAQTVCRNNLPLGTITTRNWICDENGGSNCGWEGSSSAFTPGVLDVHTFTRVTVTRVADDGQPCDGNDTVIDSGSACGAIGTGMNSGTFNDMNGDSLQNASLSGTGAGIQCTEISSPTGSLAGLVLHGVYPLLSRGGLDLLVELIVGPVDNASCSLVP